MITKIHQAAALARKIHNDVRGVSLMELCFAMPLLFGLIFVGLEAGNYTIAHLKVGHVATTLADNASRMGLASGLSNPQMTERDVNEAFRVASLEAGSLDLFAHGRVILSSLQRNANDGQWIAWQRCKGTLNVTSSYGVEGDGASGTSFPGMGPNGEEVKAEANDAVMYVEVVYDYQPIFNFSFADLVTPQIKYRAAFPVRDTRDLTGIFNPSPAVTASSCNIFSAS